KHVLQSQFKSAFTMLNYCVAEFGEKYWEGKIANATFRQIAYHTLFFTDLYLSASKDAFELRDLHKRGGDERGPSLSSGLTKEETLQYVKICRRKLVESLAAETAQS